MKIESYKALEAYKRSFELVKQVYRLTKNFPKDEIYGIVSQLRRASISIPANIAEGYVRGSKEYLQFLRIALGSSAEVETLLALSKELSFGKLEEIFVADSLNIEVTKLLRCYIKRLSEKIAISKQ